MLRQDQFAFDRFRVIDTVIMGNRRLWSALEEREVLYAKTAMTDEDGMRLGELEGIVGDEDGYTAESDAAILLQGLDIADELHERTMGELQGGQKVRVLLAQALFGHPQALLLDEPTNHLDLDSIHWLREFLVRYDGTLIVISHDRHFLNAVCTHIADIDYQTIITYTGGYDDMVAGQDADSLARRVGQRAAGEEDRAAQRLHRPVPRRHARQPGDVAPEGSRAAADHRAGAVEHPAPVHQVRDEPAVGPRRARVCRASARPTAARRSSPASAPSSIAARRSCWSAGTARARRRCSRRCSPTPPASIRRRRDIDRGTVKWGHEVSVGYFPQDHTGAIEKGLTAVEWLHRFDPDASRQDIHGLLGQMLFSGEEGLKPTDALSGGETARLLFCRIMLQKPNVLVLDEPTNHLDLESINALNVALQRFEGTVFLVTHDQDLMEEVGTRVWHFEDGAIQDFKGAYEEYAASLA